MRARAALLLLLIGAANARAEDLIFGADLRASGWQTVSFPKIAPVVFSARAGTLIVAADSAAGLLWYALKTPRPAPATAQWSWKVEQGVPPTDLTRRGEDDRALAVYFVFGAAGDAAKGPMALLSASTVTCLVYVFGGSGRDRRCCQARIWVSGGSSSFCGRPMAPSGNGCRRPSI